MAKRFVAAEEAFQKATQIMSAECQFRPSDRHNAKYDRNALCHSLMALPINDASTGSGKN